MAKRKGKFGFGKFAILYGLILICAGSICLRVLWDYMEDYESTRISHYVDEYVSTLGDEQILAAASDFLNSLDPYLQDRALAEETVLSQSNGDFSCILKSADTSGTDMTYAILLDGKKIGEVEFCQKPEKTAFGFHYWETKAESMSLSYPELVESKSVTVPSDCEVLCNGKTLSDEYMTETGIQYELCEEFYDSGYTLPTKSTYTVGNLIGDITFTVCKPDGTTLDVTDGFDEAAYLNNCSEEKQQEVKDFFDDFVYFYVLFSSGVNTDHLLDYYNVSAYVLDGSAVEQRMYQAIEGLTYTNTKSAVIRSLDVTYCMQLDNGDYLCDVVYTVDNMNYYQTEYTRTVSEIKVILQDTDKGLQIAEMLTVRTGLADEQAN